MTNPQAVTERYISNLLHFGQNKDFALDMLVRRSSYSGFEHVGYYFTAKVVSNSGSIFEASAATAASAVRRTLEAAGVTFR